MCTHIYVYFHVCMTCVSLGPGPVRSRSVMSISEVPSWNQLRHDGTTSVHSLFSFIVSWYRACKILNMGLTLQIYRTRFPDITFACCRTAPVYIVQYRCDLEKTQVGLLKRFWMQQRCGFVCAEAVVDILPPEADSTVQSMATWLHQCQDENANPSLPQNLLLHLWLETCFPAVFTNRTVI